MSDDLKRARDEADRLRGVIRDVCSAMDPAGHVTAENVEQKAEEMRREIERLKCAHSDIATLLNGRLAEATAENERLQRALANHKALLAAAETAGREVCDERDAAASALDVEIGRGDKATGHVYSLAERINFVIGGLRDEARRGDEAEDKVDRQAREIERLKADLLLLGALKSAEVAPVIERFREAFGADVPQAPGLTDDRLDLLLSEAAAGNAQR